MGQPGLLLELSLHLCFLSSLQDYVRKDLGLLLNSRTDWSEDVQRKERPEAIIQCEGWRQNACVLRHSVVPSSYNLTDCSLPGSSIHRIFQAKIPQRVAISFSKMRKKDILDSGVEIEQPWKEYQLWAHRGLNWWYIQFSSVP